MSDSETRPFSFPLVAIMQPTFAPWLGYFDLMDRVDFFVLLDDVQLSHQSFQTRNRIKGSSCEPRWLSISHEKSGKPASRMICNTAILNTEVTATRFMAVLRENYRNSPWLDYVCSMLSEAFGSETFLGGLNSRIILSIADLLGIQTPVVHSSSLNIDENRSLKVLGILNSVDWGTYVAVPGAVDYMVTDGAFVGLENRVLVEAFEPIEYKQQGSSFVSHLSILDAILEIGPEATLRTIREGRRPLKKMLECSFILSTEPRDKLDIGGTLPQSP